MEKIARFKWPILLATIGIALEFAAVFLVLGELQDSGTSFLAPGQASINVPKPGNYTLWHESRTLVDGKFMSFPDDVPSGTTIKVFKLPEGTPVPLRKGGASTMQSGGTRRVSVGQLTFSSPGEYQVVVTGLDEKRAFYLAEGNFLSVLLGVMTCGLFGTLFLAAAIGSGIYLLVRSPRRAA